MNIDDEIKSAMPAVMERIKRDTLDRMERVCIEEALNAARNAASEWAVENLVPEIKAQLEEGKAGFVQQAHVIAGDLSAAIGAALVDHVTQQMKNSWNRKKIADALFS